MSDRPNAVDAIENVLTEYSGHPRGLGLLTLDALRAAAGCVPGQPLVILDNGELTTADRTSMWGRDIDVAFGFDIEPYDDGEQPDDAFPLFRIPGAEEAPNG